MHKDNETKTKDTHRKKFNKKIMAIVSFKQVLWRKKKKQRRDNKLKLNPKK